MRDFVVAAWESGRHRKKDLRRVEADTAEHAVSIVAADRPVEKQDGVYEVWPARNPETNLRITLAKPRVRQLPLSF